jgi:hypothetical protein
MLGKKWELILSRVSGDVPFLFTHSVIALLSYVWPSSATTGSLMTTIVIGHVRFISQSTYSMHMYCMRMRLHPQEEIQSINKCCTIRSTFWCCFSPLVFFLPISLKFSSQDSLEVISSFRLYAQHWAKVLSSEWQLIFSLTCVNTLFPSTQSPSLCSLLWISCSFLVKMKSIAVFSTLFCVFCCCFASAGMITFISNVIM